jgi:hypothetical protein
VSALTDRLTEDDFRELARTIRRIHARTAARHERERLDAGREPCQCPACEYTRRCHRLPGRPPGSSDDTAT